MRKTVHREQTQIPISEPGSFPPPADVAYAAQEGREKAERQREAAHRMSACNCATYPHKPGCPQAKPVKP